MWWLQQGDSVEMMKCVPDGSVDALVTDPPAGISFMGKEWDDAKGGRDKWIAWLAGILAECRRAMKPGAYGWVWALPRTAHWTATACEDAGFAVRDVMTHVFGTGFPKSQALLKPAGENWILIKAPGELRELRIDECRIATQDKLGGGRDSGPTKVGKGWDRPWMHDENKREYYAEMNRQKVAKAETLGRWPANFALSHSDDCGDVCATDCPVKMLDRQSGDSVSRVGKPRKSQKPGDGYGMTYTGAEYSDSGGASRFFMTFSGSCGHEKTEADDTSVGKRVVDSDANLSIGGYGNAHTDPSQKVITSTTATETLSTTSSTTSNACQRKNTGQNITENANDIESSMALNSENASDVSNINRFPTSLNAQPELGTDIVNLASRNTSSSGGPRIEIIGTNTIVPITKSEGHRFFYVAKPSSKERSQGLAEGARNTHTTVKSIALMRHLINLVAAPGALVLDPFCGSGSTGVAALLNGCRFVGIEREQEYVDIAMQRLRHAALAPST